MVPSSLQEKIFLEVKDMTFKEVSVALCIEKEQTLSLKRMIVSRERSKRAFCERLKVQSAEADALGKHEVVEALNEIILTFREWSCDEDLLNSLISDLEQFDSGQPIST